MSPSAAEVTSAVYFPVILNNLFLIFGIVYEQLLPSHPSINVEFWIQKSSLISKIEDSVSTSFTSPLLCSFFPTHDHTYY